MSVVSVFEGLFALVLTALASLALARRTGLNAGLFPLGLLAGAGVWLTLWGMAGLLRPGGWALYALALAGGQAALLKGRREEKLPARLRRNAAELGREAKKAPALVLDLHEARQWNDGRDELGNSLICQDMQPVADLVWGLLEASADGQLHGSALDLFGSPPVGSLNRTLPLEAGIPVITVETSRVEPLPQRVKNQLEIAEYVLKNQGLR